MNCVVGVEMERSEGNLWRTLEGLQLCKIVKASQGTPDPQGRADHLNTQHSPFFYFNTRYCRVSVFLREQWRLFCTLPRNFPSNQVSF